MKRYGIALAILSTILVIAGVSAVTYGAYSSATATQAPVISKYDTGPPDATEMLELVNAERAKVQSAPLTMSAVMTENAQWKSDDMVARGYWQHKLPGTLVLLDETHLKAANMYCLSSAENLTKNVHTSREVVSVWMSSTDGHREALQNSIRDITGFGITIQEDGTYLVAEHFCDAK